MKTMTNHEKAVLADLRAGEKAYPIYRVRARWSEADPPDAECRMHWAGMPPLPEGRCWNSTSWYTMEREERDIDEITAEIVRNWWPVYAAKRPEPDDLSVEVAFATRDVWCSGWFSHWTWDVGMSDIEVLESFGRYVDRILYSGRPDTEIGGLLMGAEDRWRWRGCVTGDPQGPHTDPPCRCPHCQSTGRIRIDH